MKDKSARQERAFLPALQWVQRLLAACAWLACAFGAQAEVKPAFTWAPFGHALVKDMNETEQGIWPSLRTFSTDAGSVCAQRIYKFIGPKFCPSKYLPGGAHEGAFCTVSSLSCDEGAYDEDQAGIGLVCHDYPTRGRPRWIRGYIRDGGSDGYGRNDLCSCPEGTRPDFPSGYCVNPRDLTLTASRTRYTAREAGKPVDLEILVFDGNQNYPAAGQRVTLEILPSGGGEAGTLSATTGTTDEAGRVRSSYTFPRNFDKVRIDTIRATCSSCEEPATVELKMAPVVVGFFNGVWNTPEQAQDGLAKLKELIEPSTNGASVRYERFYNQTGCGNPGTTCLQDIAETFAQRGSEINGVLGKRWEHFWDVLAGRYADPSSLTGDLLGRLTGAVVDLARLLDNAFEAALGQIVTLTVRMASDPPTSTDMAAHVAKLQALADDGSDFVLIAHSQGNLFVNASYDGLLASRPDAKAKVVHVAPASPTVRGEHVLADIDLVINGLRVQGITSVQPININLPFSKADASGHTLVGTYLDATRAARDRVKTMVQTALDAL